MIKTYEVTCEGVIRRMVVVEAHHVVEAEALAKKEFAALIGAEEEAVAAVDTYTEPVTFTKGETK